jgi:predicted nuclease with TOPRIM domain
MSPQEFHLMEEMDAEELRDELRRIHIYNMGLVEQRAKAATALHSLFHKWEEQKPLEKKDWSRLMSLVY